MYCTITAWTLADFSVISSDIALFFYRPTKSWKKANHLAFSCRKKFDRTRKDEQKGAKLHQKGVVI